MTRAAQMHERRLAQGLCEARYEGNYRLFLSARCKLAEGHGGEFHRTWRISSEDGDLILQWKAA